MGTFLIGVGLAVTGRMSTGAGAAAASTLWLVATLLTAATAGFTMA